MRLATWMLVCVVWAVACGCGQSPPAPAPGGPAPPVVRIVSLSPAISRTLIDLEMDHLVVGRTPFCDSLDRAIPVVGDLHDLDFETLVRVRPTHVLVQPPVSGINPRLVEQAEKRGWSLHAWRLDGFTDISELIRDLPGAVFAQDIETQIAAGERAIALMGQLLEFLQSHDLDAPQSPRTLLIFGTDPVSAFGTETYLHELFLVLGGRNATNVKGYPQYTLEDVARINPEAVILVRPNASPDDLSAFGPILRMEIDAVRDDRLAILTHPDALLPSSAVIGVAEELRDILRSMNHGDIESQRQPLHPQMNTDEHR